MLRNNGGILNIKMKLVAKRGFNSFDIPINYTSKNSDSYLVSIDITCEDTTDFKLFAIDRTKQDKTSCISSKTSISYSPIYNEIPITKTYSINVLHNNADIKLCFHSMKNTDIEVTNIKTTILDNDVFTLSNDYDNFINKTEYPTWRQLVQDDIHIETPKKSVYPLIETTYSKEEILAMMDVLVTDRLTMGKNVSQFEEYFAKYVGTKYAIMVNSGSSANLLSMAVATNPSRKNFLKPGDKVIVPNVCWSTSVFPILQMNLVPVFVDVNPQTLNMDIHHLKSIMTSEIKGIVAVHILGNSTDMDELMKIVKDNNLFLMEDTCESLGSTYNNQYLGTFGDFGSYSFYYSHHITTVEGGMVVCNNDEDYELLKCIRAHGWTRYLKDKVEIENEYSDIDPRFLFVNTGYNLRPMETQGAMGIIQLKKLNEKNRNRVTNYKNITINLLNDNRNKGYFSVPSATNNCSPAWFCMPMIMSSDISHLYKKFLSYLTENGVENRPIVTGNFTRQPVCKKFIEDTVNPEVFIGAEILHKQAFFIGLPCEEMRQDRVENLIDIIFNFDFNQ